MLSYHYLGLPTVRVVYANANKSKRAVVECEEELSSPVCQSFVGLGSCRHFLTYFKKFHF